MAVPAATLSADANSTKGAAQSATSHAETLCFVSSRSFRLLWWAIFFIYSVVALQLVLLAGFYFLLMGFPSVTYYLAMFHLIALDKFPVVIAAYAFMGVLVYSEIFHIVSYSVRHRRLCLLNESALTEKATRVTKTSPSRFAIFESVWHLYVRIVSVRGPYFDVVMLLRELVEIVVQVFQAYQSSRYTPNTWLNFCFGVLITINCLSSPIIERFFRADLGRERLNVLLMDLGLDFVWLLIPMMLFPHYIQGFFGGEAVMYEDTFMVRAFMESQLLMVASHADLFSKMLPSLSIFFTIRKIRILVRRREPLQSYVVTASIAVKPESASASATAASVTANHQAKAVSTDQTDRLQHKSYLPRHLRHLYIVQRVLVVVLLALGAFTVVMYALTVVFRGTCEPGCKLVLHPWFVFSRCRCAVQEISCFTRGIEGSRLELLAVFEALERPGLQPLIISHCRQFEMPSEIRWFQDLYGFELYNSTIASWPANASLQAAHFPRLGFVYLVRTHIDVLPDGLLQGDLPPSLLEIDVIVSNLSNLPDDLDKKWPSIRTIYLDQGRFSTPPRVLGRMQLESLSLLDNGIRVIPNDTFATSKFNYLVLNGNPLDQLPASLGSVDKLYELQIQQTAVTSVLSTWSKGQILPSRFKIYARGSPVCVGFDVPDNPISSTVSSAASFDLESNGLRVSCGIRGSLYRGERSRSYFALEGKTLDRNP